MLPTKGYFQDIECPYYDTSCGRPYCHFRHRKKPTENTIVEEPGLQKQLVEPQSKNIIPTYRPTPKSELENLQITKSHIPISYVPDLAFRPERLVRPPVVRYERLIYKPTPLSVLSSAVKANNSENPVTEDLKQSIGSAEYDPLKSEINFEDLSTEFDLIDEIINNDDIEGKFSSDSDDGKETDKSKSNCSEIVVLNNDVPVTENCKPETNIEIKDNKSNDVKTNTVKPEKKRERSSSSSSKNKDKSNKDSSSVSKNSVSKDSNCDKISKSKSNVSDKLNKSKSSSKEKHKSSSSKEKSESSSNSSSKAKKPSTTVEPEKDTTSTSSKDRHKHHKSSSKEKHRKEEKRKDTDKNSKRSSTTSSNVSSKTKEKESKYNSKDKKDSKSKTSSSSSKKSKDVKDKRKKDDSSGKDNRNRHNSKSKSRSKSKHSRKSSTSDNSSSVSEYSDNDNSNNIHTEILVPEPQVDVSDIDFDDEDDTMMECFKIFNEYKPEPIKPRPDNMNQIMDNEQMQESYFELKQTKKRTAHDGGATQSKLQPVAEPKYIPTPGEILRERYKLAKQAQAAHEGENIMNEIRHIVDNSTAPIVKKRPAPVAAPSLLEAARTLKKQRTESKPKVVPSSTSLVDDILNGTAKTSTLGVNKVKKRIAAPVNVALIQKAKERINKIISNSSTSTQQKTIAQTQKANSRVAHVPEYSLSDIPDVLQAAKSKLPVNVRTRFLTMLADECVKLYAGREDAYSRALNEEFSCYEKCKVLATYRNSAMLAVNRLRKELKDRESRGLGPLLAGESIQSEKPDDFNGKRFYHHIKKWLLSEEDLDLHGYPRQSGEKGRVVIINKKKEMDYSLDETHRRCTRCHKTYQVDDDGWPLHMEECNYHPLKKRTIRGEQVFLCCKTGIETGCASADSHVNDGLECDLLTGYQSTMEPEREDDPRSWAVYALDCEMCYTTKGLELTRVTIVDTECKTVYESLVRPLNPIVDYNTRFSGITAEQMNRTSTSILQIQANILHLCNSRTILIGHSLESDMKALKIVHTSIVDTSVLFPHKMGLPHKRALKALASEHLRKIIQDNVNGHDSAEDAVSCMELVKWKLREELKSRK